MKMSFYKSNKIKFIHSVKIHLKKKLANWKQLPCSFESWWKTCNRLYWFLLKAGLSLKETYNGQSRKTTICIMMKYGRCLMALSCCEAQYKGVISRSTPSNRSRHTWSWFHLAWIWKYRYRWYINYCKYLSGKTSSYKPRPRAVVSPYPDVSLNAWEIVVTGYYGMYSRL